MADKKTDDIGALIQQMDRERAGKPIDDYSNRSKPASGQSQSTPAKRPQLDDYFARPMQVENQDPLSGLSDHDRGRVEALCTDKLIVDAGVSAKDLGNVKNKCLDNARNDLAAMGKISR